MARAVPQYKGAFNNSAYNLDKEERKLNNFEGDILKLFPESPDDIADEFAECFDSDRQRFVVEIINAIRWTKSEIYYMQFDTLKEETCAEQKDLLRIARNTEEGLNSLIEKIPIISPGLDRLLGADFNSDEIVETLKNDAIHLQQLIDFLVTAEPWLNNLPKAAKVQVKDHKVASELAHKILNILEEYGIKVTTINSAYWDKSNLINFLVKVDKFLGLRLCPVTWVNNVNMTLKIRKNPNPQSVGESR